MVFSLYVVTEAAKKSQLSALYPGNLTSVCYRYISVTLVLAISAII